MQLENPAAGRIEMTAEPPTVFEGKIMTAVLYDDVLYVDSVTTPPAPTLTLKPAPKRAPGRGRQSPIGVGGDPLVDAATRLLSIPLRQVYAVLWRVGVIEVVA
jgi:hypothetical protein